MSELHRRCTVAALRLRADPKSVALEMRWNCIKASWEKSRILNVMEGMERRMPEQGKEASRRISRTTATGACERPASSR
jgi:hypothetical protein